MPPANSPTNTHFPPDRSPELDLLSQIESSLPAQQRPFNINDSEQAVDEDNVSFLRTSLPHLNPAQYEPDEGNGIPPSFTPIGWQEEQQPQPLRNNSEDFLLDPRITQSERETVRRLRRYVLNSQRPHSFIPSGAHDVRGTPSLRSRVENRYETYQGWAPGSTENDVVEPPMSMMDLRALARGGSRRLGEGEAPTRPYPRSLLQPMRHMLNNRETGLHRSGESRQDRSLRSYAGEMEWEPQPRRQQQGENAWDADWSRGHDRLDTSLRTTALLQSVRRHARFSPRPFLTQQQDAEPALGIPSLDRAERLLQEHGRRYANALAPHIDGTPGSRADSYGSASNQPPARAPLSVPSPQGGISLGHYARLRHQRMIHGAGSGGGNAGTASDHSNTNNNSYSQYSNRYHQSNHPQPSTLSEGSKWLEEAIKYLERLRYCDAGRSSDEWMQFAEAGGFVRGHLFTHHNHRNDFVVDTSVISPPPPSSWLQPGSVFGGSQKSTSSMNLSMSNRATPTGTTTSASESRRHRRLQEDRLSPTHFAASLERLNAAVSGGQQRTALDPDWIDSVLSRRQEVAGALLQRIDAHNAAHGTLPGRDSRILPAADATRAPSTVPPKTNEESWPVKVTITSVDYDKMRLTGTMEAFDVPNKANPSQRTTIATYLEGEIIDFRRYTLETTSFNATSVVDSTYWRELEPFRSLADSEIVHNLLSAKWLCEELSQKYVLMRWKERCFITPSDAQVHLTISGFYYVSLRRDDGRLEGLYYDPTSTPYQHLVLNAESRMFPAYDFQAPLLHSN